jgi:hypothetical protein
VPFTEKAEMAKFIQDSRRRAEPAAQAQPDLTEGAPITVGDQARQAASSRVEQPRGALGSHRNPSSGKGQ